MKIVNYEEKEMIPLTKEDRSLLKIKKLATYAKKSFVWIKMIKIKLIEKRLKIIVITQENLDELLIANATYINYKVPKDIPIKINNASYNTHFIINQLAEEFNGEHDCIGDNMEKHITFSVPITKECDDVKTITRKLRFIDSFRFMSTSLSELVDNMSGIFNSIECKSCIEKIKINSECCFVGLKNNRLIYRCKKCKEEWKRPIN